VIVVLLEFDPAVDNSERLALRPQHRERLTALLEAGEVVMAGPYSDESGSLILFSTTAERVAEILADDPYYSAPDTRVAATKEWNPPIGAPAQK
jgi:hypothetical protein